MNMMCVDEANCHYPASLSNFFWNIKPLPLNHDLAKHRWYPHGAQRTLCLQGSSHNTYPNLHPMSCTVSPLTAKDLGKTHLQRKMLAGMESPATSVLADIEWIRFFLRLLLTITLTTSRFLSYSSYLTFIKSKPDQKVKWKIGWSY